MSLGPSIEADGDTHRLPIEKNAARVQAPVGAYGDWAVIREDAADSRAPQQTTVYELWNINTGETRPGWETPVDTQDSVHGVSGDWIVTVRTGFSLPFEEWHLIMRNLRTGEVREIAQYDPRVIQVPDLPVRLPAGFAPVPSISGSWVTWSEFALRADGAAEKRIELYDLTEGKRSTLLTVDPNVEDVWSPSVAGNRVAWVHRPAEGDQELVVDDLATGTRRSYPAGGDIYSCALSGDGRFLAWDDDYFAKYARDLESGNVLQYAGDEGWGTERSGHYVSWQPSTVSYVEGEMSSGAAGYYDFEQQELRFVSHATASIVVSAGLMGDWFIWQDRNPGGLSDTYYYFLKLDP